ncbi:N-formylglutamate amidohydrolase [Labrys okinawensis]|uniref:N-formylglutamate amidohydrolase n=1 Tax=Labrys okinawensis TaxID=346911 RepID=UPI0039BD6F4A
MEIELTPPFDVVEPATHSAPLLFNSPHSGRVYPRTFLESSRLDAHALRRSEDAFVDLLLADVAGTGSALMSARFPRAYLDVNREPYELDPRMFDGRLPNYANTRSLRVAGGLGTLARVVSESQEIYARRLPVDEALRRIEELYKPYHRTLRRLLGEIHREFGVALLVDCHSMPSCGLAREERPRADIVLGDRYGTSCSHLIMDCADDTLRSLGYSVGRNKPYAGGYITEHYGNPGAGFHVIQVEINRALYMNERDFTPLPAFDRLKQDLVALRDALAALPFHYLDAFHLAAE